MSTLPYRITPRELQLLTTLRSLLPTQAEAIIKAAEILLAQQNSERHTPADPLFLVKHHKT